MSHSLRSQAVGLIDDAVKAGARQVKACEVLEISVRTYQRWREGGEVVADRRPTATRPAPSHALTPAERQQVLDVLNSAEFASMPPSQVVPRLADQGKYVCSESTMYRVLHEHKQQHHRGRSQQPERRAASTHGAEAPNEVWCWDITWLPGAVKGQFYFLYLILDVFSRKIVGWEIHEEESAENASRLLRKACMKESLTANDISLVLHSANGSPMTGASMLETLNKLGVVSSFSRPRVSNDNAYAESIFRTCKYRPGYPYKGFKDITEAREWALQFSRWYNHEHRHSGIKFVTPHEKHEGLDQEILEARKVVYENAKKLNPRRWTGAIRNWDPIKLVWLNPEKNDEKIENTL